MLWLLAETLDVLPHKPCSNLDFGHTDKLDTLPQPKALGLTFPITCRRQPRTRNK